jgi:hypothetical protein
MAHQSSYLLKKPHLIKNVEKIEEVDGEDDDNELEMNERNDSN